MRIIDPHCHMYSRTVDDYEMMVLCGIEALVEPSFWLGNDRQHAGSFYDYFNHISEWEPKNRAAKRGMKHFCTIGMNPKEAENIELAREVIKGMMPYLDRPTAVGIGEIGFNNITPNEEKILAEQLVLAKKLDVPVIIHTPHNNKLEGTLRTIALCKEIGVNPLRIDIDHNTEETIQHTLDGGFYAGITMYPRTKCTPQRARDMVERYGSERILLNSACDWETSDPLTVPKAARLMLQTGFTRAQTRGVVWENPYQFLAQSPKFKTIFDPIYNQDRADGIAHS
ncbi:MAG TPA: TatD family hydrolase [Planctomycetota bacterium]|nr:TatD family hydrolase [Planctomycetota bacterium]